MQGDSIYLSPNYLRDSCHLTLCIRNPTKKDRLRYFVGLYGRFVERGFQPRVHWGKYFDLGELGISDILPGVKRFLDNQHRLDPNNVFVNNLLSETFGL